MNKSLLDTDILSEILKGRNVRVGAKAEVYRGEFQRLTISAVTVVEIVKGLHRVDRKDALATALGVFATLEVLPWDTESAILAGRIYGDLEKRGLPIGRADPMIAAIALSHQHVLVTGNAEHFQRIASLGYTLQLDDWRK